MVDELRHRLIDQGYHGLDGDDGRNDLVQLPVEHGAVTTDELGLLR